MRVSFSFGRKIVNNFNLKVKKRALQNFGYVQMTSVSRTGSDQSSFRGIKFWKIQDFTQKALFLD
jgi:hypothetical protein